MISINKKYGNVKKKYMIGFCTFIRLDICGKQVENFAGCVDRFINK